VSIVLQVQTQTLYKRILYCTAKLSISLRSPIYATACCCATTQEIKWTSRRLKSLLTVGATLWVISGVAVFVLPSQMSSLMYPLAMVIGAANALVMVSKTHTAEPAPSTPRSQLAACPSIRLGASACSGQVTTIGLEGALVGEDLNGCAFVYGSLSFLDKISCGIALFALESYEGK
jgi:hypothetical protein